MLTTSQAVEIIHVQGYVPDIGQMPKLVRRDLDRMVKRGELCKYRGYWNTGSPAYGVGPLKTCFARP